MTEMHRMMTRPLPYEDWSPFFDWLESRRIYKLIDGISLFAWMRNAEQWYQAEKNFTVWCPERHRVEFKLRWG